MHILLINANPVVSRLLILCTRDDTVVLDEVETVDEVAQNVYDVVFVDEASYGRDVAELLATLKNTKKVFISYRSDEMRGFDVTIKKPFLPSQITELIAEVEAHKDDEVVEMEEETLMIEEEEIADEMPSIFPLSAEEEEPVVETLEEEVNAAAVLDVDEIEKIKALLDMDEDLEVPETELSDEEIEARKIEVIKEQLIADGLEIVDENEIVEELSIGLDGSLHAVEKADKASNKDKTKRKKSKKKKTKSKKLKFTEENMEHIEDAVEMAMASMTKKQMKKLLKGKEVEVTIKLEDKN